MSLLKFEAGPLWGVHRKVKADLRLCRPPAVRAAGLGPMRRLAAAPAMSGACGQARGRAASSRRWLAGRAFRRACPLGERLRCGEVGAAAFQPLPAGESAVRQRQILATLHCGALWPLPPTRAKDAKLVSGHLPFAPCGRRGAASSAGRAPADRAERLDPGSARVQSVAAMVVRRGRSGAGGREDERDDR
jgi:hypothetical protein